MAGLLLAALELHQEYIGLQGDGAKVPFRAPAPRESTVEDVGLGLLST